VDGRIILKRIQRDRIGRRRLCSGCTWNTLLWKRKWTSGYHNVRDISWVIEKIQASRSLLQAVCLFFDCLCLIDTDIIWSAMAYLKVLSYPTISDLTLSYQSISHPTLCTVHTFSVSPQLSDQHYAAPLVMSTAGQGRREWLHSPIKKLFRVWRG